MICVSGFMEILLYLSVKKCLISSKSLISEYRSCLHVLFKNESGRMTGRTLKRASIGRIHSIILRIFTVNTRCIKLLRDKYLV